MSCGWSKDYYYTERLMWQNPNLILSEVGLITSKTLVDIGCGDGFSSLAAAKMVGADGLVYAIDADINAIAAITTKASAAGINNIRFLLGNVEESVPCPTLADVAILDNVLHD